MQIAEKIDVEIWPSNVGIAMVEFGGPIGFPAFSRISRLFVC